MGKDQGDEIGRRGKWPGTPEKLAAGALLYSDTRVYLVEAGNEVRAAR
jgi:hypothetical protein